MKHIESIQPEYAADDMTALLLSDATASAALTALLHNVTGCAIPPTADTPESEVEELVPLCLSILRRHWQTPLTALGDGNTPMSLADLLRRLIGDRVQGNEALGIPPANANIPTAVAALRDRDMSSGLTLTLTDGTIMPLPDGLSLAQLLCSAAANDVTAIVDDNVDWTCTKGNYVSSLNGLFPSAEEITLRCKEVAAVQTSFTSSTIKRLNIVGAKTIVGALCINLPDGEINAPDLETLTLSGYNNGWVGPIGKVIYMPKVTTINGYNRYFQGNTDMPIERWVLGTLKSLGWNQWGWVGSASAPKMIHFEICADGGKLAMSLNLDFWTATNAIDASRTDLIEEGSTAANNLEQFLSNFKAYIAQRLTDKGSGLTLTLSQAVRDAIQQDPDIVNIITSKGWTISPAPSV